MNNDLKTFLNTVSGLLIAAALFMIIASFWVGRPKTLYFAVIAMAIFFLGRINNNVSVSNNSEANRKKTREE